MRVRGVAIKVVNPRLAPGSVVPPPATSRSAPAARLNHPHIADVHDYGASITPDGDPVPFVVMKLVDVQTLASRLAGGRAMPTLDAALAVPRSAADVTFTELSLQQQSTIEAPSSILVRKVKRRQANYHELILADRLVRDLVDGTVTRDQARDRLMKIVSAPRRRTPWAVTAGWGAVGASLAVTLGGGAVVSGLAFLAACGIDLVGRGIDPVHRPTAGAPGEVKTGRDVDQPPDCPAAPMSNQQRKWLRVRFTPFGTAQPTDASKWRRSECVDATDSSRRPQAAAAPGRWDGGHGRGRMPAEVCGYAPAGRPGLR